MVRSPELGFTAGTFKLDDSWKVDYEALNGISPDFKIERNSEGQVVGYDEVMALIERLETDGTARHTETAMHLREELSLSQ